MGLNIQSNVISKSLDDVSNIVNSVSVNISQNINSNCTALQNARIQVGGLEQCGVEDITITGGSIGITQNSNTNCVINGSVVSNMSVQDINNLKTSLTDQVNTDFDTKQGLFALGTSIQSNVVDIKNKIITNISQITTESLAQACQSTIANYNNGEILICASLNNVPVFVDQNTNVTAVTNCMVKSVLNQVFNTQELKDYVTTVDTKLKSEQEGIGSLFKWLIIIAAVVAVALIIGLIIFAVAGGFKSTPTSEGGTGKSPFDSLLATAAASGGSSSSSLAALESNPEALALMA